MRTISFLPMTRHIRCVRPLSVTLMAFLFTTRSYSQDGKTGIQQATTMINGYFPAVVNLMYVIGAVVGIIGAIKVYNAWSHGDQQTNKLAASWFGACIFLVTVAACLKSFFGVTG